MFCGKASLTGVKVTSSRIIVSFLCLLGLTCFRVFRSNSLAQVGGKGGDTTLAGQIVANKGNLTGL